MLMMHHSCVCFRKCLRLMKRDIAFGLTTLLRVSFLKTVGGLTSDSFYCVLFLVVIYSFMSFINTVASG